MTLRVVPMDEHCFSAGDCAPLNERQLQLQITSSLTGVHLEDLELGRDDTIRYELGFWLSISTELERAVLE